MVISLLIIFGLALGSFVNALVWRLYQQHLPRKKRAAKDTDLSIATGRSMCIHCKHTLAWYDLFPLISWVSLRGKCRYCAAPIGWQYPLVEAATAALFVASYTYWPSELLSLLDWVLLALWLVFLTGLIALFIYDIKWMLLPNRIVFPLIGVGLIMALLRASCADGFWASILNSIGALFIAGGLFYILFQVSEGKWIGGGDVKLGFALGLVLGSPVLAFLMLFTSSLLGILVMLPSLLVGNSTLKVKIPFGPFLIVATFIAMLFGQQVIDWYSASLLYT